MADRGVSIGDVVLLLVSFLTSLCVVLIFIVLGWYIVWVAFLSRFKLMRELLSVSDEDTSKEKPAPPEDQAALPQCKATAPKSREGKTSSALLSTASSSSATRRTRQHISPMMT